ncbi:phage protease [Marinobacterium litorale]|uniref:phage protease n=1 Tax=Marinobacterium litorale TaxID=404770 RepID=UPI000685F173|nr:phage protease [Marinobacterium litorale]
MPLSPEVMAFLRSNSAHQGAGLSVLSLNGAATQNGWQQLLPSGHFRAVDGRPYDVPGGMWFLNREGAEKLIQDVQARVNDLVVDYEHQTLLSEENGKPAPAAGWFKEIEWREGSGLWIKPTWTPRAKGYIQNGEYRYLSAVFPYDKKTGVPVSLHSAALVNKPGLDGLTAVASLKAPTEKSVSIYATSSLGAAALSSAERKALGRAYVNTSTYLNKREAFCRSRGTSWAQLTALTPEEVKVIQLTGIDKEAFTATKLTLLAEDILRSS